MHPSTELRRSGRIQTTRQQRADQPAEHVTAAGGGEPVVAGGVDRHRCIGIARAAPGHQGASALEHHHRRIALYQAMGGGQPVGLHLLGSDAKQAGSLACVRGDDCRPLAMCCTLQHAMAQIGTHGEQIQRVGVQQQRQWRPYGQGQQLDRRRREPHAGSGHQRAERQATGEQLRRRSQHELRVQRIDCRGLRVELPYVDAPGSGMQRCAPRQPRGAEHAGRTADETERPASAFVRICRQMQRVQVQAVWINDLHAGENSGKARSGWNRPVPLLSGVRGADEFQFELLHHLVEGTRVYQKTITDFDSNGADGETDAIDMSDLAEAINLRFNAFSTTSTWSRGDLITVREGNNTVILGNVDNDLAAEIRVVLVGLTTFDSNLLDLG